MFAIGSIKLIIIIIIWIRQSETSILSGRTHYIHIICISTACSCCPCTGTALSIFVVGVLPWHGQPRDSVIGQLSVASRSSSSNFHSQSRSRVATRSSEPRLWISTVHLSCYCCCYCSPPVPQCDTSIRYRRPTYPSKYDSSRTRVAK